MMPVLLGEYRNQNSNRLYPFGDSATLTDTTGASLPADFIIDACLYPVDIQGSVYLHSINTATNQVYFGDSEAVTDTAFAVCTYTNTTDTAYVYETGPYARQIGVVVFGPGVSGVLGGTVVRLFEHDATGLCATACTAMVQSGVRGVLLDDGTLITGAITLVAGTGMNIISYQSGDDGYVYFDMYGTLPPTDEDCAGAGVLTPLITQICFERVPNSLFSIAAYGAGVSVSGYGFSQDDICRAQRERGLPDSSGVLPFKPGSEVCNPVPPPDPPDPGASQSECVDVASLPGGTVIIVTPSSGLLLNPIAVAGVKGAFGPSSFVQSRPVGSLSEVAGQLQRFMDPPIFADGLRISVKGLSTYRRSL